MFMPRGLKLQVTTNIQYDLNIFEPRVFSSMYKGFATIISYFQQTSWAVLMRSMASDQTTHWVSVIYYFNI